MLVMYRNGATVRMSGQSGGMFWQRLVEQYLDGGDWWPLKSNESMWIVPGTVHEMTEKD